MRHAAHQRQDELPRRISFSENKWSGLLLFHRPQLRTDKNHNCFIFYFSFHHSLLPLSCVGLFFRENCHGWSNIKPHNILAIYTNFADELNCSCRKDANCNTDSNQSSRFPSKDHQRIIKESHDSKILGNHQLELAAEQSYEESAEDNNLANVEEHRDSKEN